MSYKEKIPSRRFFLVKSKTYIMDIVVRHGIALFSLHTDISNFSRELRFYRMMFGKMKALNVVFLARKFPSTASVNFQSETVKRSLPEQGLLVYCRA